MSPGTHRLPRTSLPFRCFGGASSFGVAAPDGVEASVEADITVASVFASSTRLFRRSSAAASSCSLVTLFRRTAAITLVARAPR